MFKRAIRRLIFESVLVECFVWRFAFFGVVFFPDIVAFLTRVFGECGANTVRNVQSSAIQRLPESQLGRPSQPAPHEEPNPPQSTGTT